MRLRVIFLAACLLVAPSVFAELPWVPFQFLNLSGGLNDGFDPTAINDNEAADLQNVVFTTGGAVTKRSGFTRINTATLSSTLAFTGIAFFRLANGTRELVATTLDGTTSRIQKMDYGAGVSGPNGTWNNISGSLTLSFNVDSHAVFTPALNQIVITDGRGVNPPYVWTGTGNASLLGGSPPNAAWSDFHKNILWVAGDTANPSRLTFSNVGDIATWTSTDFLAINTNDGQIIQGLHHGLDCEYVWKQFAIFRVCGTNRDDVTQEQMVSGIGTTCNNGIQLINNQFVFLTSEGQVAVYDGGVHLEIISSKIQGTLNGINRNRYSQCESAALEDSTGNVNYYLELSNAGSGTNNLLLVYDTTHRAWTRALGINANAMATYEIGTLQRNLVFGNYGGFASRYPNGNSDAGTTISAYYLTKQFSFPQYPQDKTWVLLESVLAQTGNYAITVNVRSDFESGGQDTVVSLAGSGALWDTAVWDVDSWADLTSLISRIEVNKRRRFFQVRYSDNTTNPAWTLKAFTIWIQPEGRI